MKIKGPLLVSFPKSNSANDKKGYYPLSVMTLYNYLYKNNIQAEFLDLETVHRLQECEIDGYVAEISNKVKDFFPAYIGFNCFSTDQFPLICSVAKEIKQLFPELPTVVGGMHPSLFAAEIINNFSFIDYVVIGEGEEASLLLVNICRGNKELLVNSQALGWRNEEGKTIINPRKSFMKEIDIPYEEAWKKISFEKYHVNTTTWNNPKQLSFETSIPIATTRSCPFSCSFCSVAGHMGKTLRRRNPQHVLDEIEFLHKEHGKNYFDFIDDNINVNKNHAMEIFNGIIKRNLNIHFSLVNGIHINSADDELISIMHDAGLAMIKLPIEHGNDYIRNKIIGKNTSKEKIFSIVKSIKQYDIFTCGLFIIGFPEETEESIADTEKIIKDLQLDMNVTAILIPFPGTKVYEQCIKDNLLVHDFKFEDAYKGHVGFDVVDYDIFIKPYNMSVERLAEHKENFNKFYFLNK